MSDHSSTDARLAKVEELLTHLQRDVEQLHEALVGQQRQHDDLRRLLTTLDDRVQRILPGSEDFDPVLDRPPHY